MEHAKRQNIGGASLGYVVIQQRDKGNLNECLDTPVKQKPCCVSCTITHLEKETSAPPYHLLTLRFLVGSVVDTLLKLRQDDVHVPHQKTLSSPWWHPSCYVFPVKRKLSRTSLQSRVVQVSSSGR
ncbi:uncharacterized protein PV06_03930 [Exophiala oligosperma]|uniref:Uncharacterized protein n=1 Tax=Exophiala oligosperma TaxID=215243 RepID=A0A0D2C716_9EURO|nr:uncharacterized protein PV06_03930 [Exophiala oligosperma]KIW45547.1 hypothetical protein PV06_03930 [Exophiala oligosperma]